MDRDWWSFAWLGICLGVLSIIASMVLVMNGLASVGLVVVFGVVTAFLGGMMLWVRNKKGGSGNVL